MTQAYDAKAGNAAAWIATNDGRGSLHWTESDAQFEARLTGGDVQPLYTHPPQSQGVPEGWLVELIDRVVPDLSPEPNQEQFPAEWSLWADRQRIRQEIAAALLSTPAAPQADEWIRCVERLPTEVDADCDGNVWFMPTNWDDGLGADRQKWTYVVAHAKRLPKNTMIWQPTDLTRPQPPQEG